MPEFTQVRNPHAPAEFPFMLRANNKNELQHYEAWCYRFLGAKAVAGAHKNSRWYQSNGYFFFRRLTDVTRFVFGARLDVPKANAGPELTGLEISQLYAKLYGAFPEARR